MNARSSNGVLVTWQTVSESRLLGFNVVRLNGSGETVRVNPVWVPAVGDSAVTENCWRSYSPVAPLVMSLTKRATSGSKAALATSRPDASRSSAVTTSVAWIQSRCSRCPAERSSRYASVARRSARSLQPRLELSGQLSFGRVVMSVQDNGPGIAADAIEQIFVPLESFSRDG